MRTFSWMLVLVTAMTLSGCPDGDKVSWPGQRQSTAPGGETAASGAEVAEGAPAAEPNAVLATQYVGNAFVAAARAHNALMQSNPRAARNEVWGLRRQLRLASQWATLDQQREINRLEGQVIELEAQLAEEDGNPQGESSTLLRNFLASYDAMVAGEGGGAGRSEDEVATGVEALEQPATESVPVP